MVDFKHSITHNHSMMKKLLFICALSLLSTTGLFGFKMGDVIKIISNQAEKLEDVIEKNADKFEKFFRKKFSKKIKITHNAEDIPLSDVTPKKTATEIHETETTKETICENVARANDAPDQQLNEVTNTDSSEPATFTVQNTTQKSFDNDETHIHQLNFSKVQDVIRNTEKSILDSFNKIKNCLPSVDFMTFTSPVYDSIININNFITTYPAVIDSFRATSSNNENLYLPYTLKTKSLITNLAHDEEEMYDKYNLFIISCEYLIVLQDIANQDSSECVNLEEKSRMLIKLDNLMKTQKSALNKEMENPENPSLLSQLQAYMQSVEDSLTFPFEKKR